MLAAARRTATRPTLALLATLVVVLASSLLVAPSATAQPSARAAASDRWCDSSHWGQPRAIPGLVRQERVAARALRTEDPDFVVQRAQASHVGVIALVSGDLERARTVLDDVDRVVSWRKHFLSDFPPGTRVSVVIERVLHRTLVRTLRRVRGIPGRLAPAIWTRGGAVVLEWTSPVPARVRSLAGVRGNGVEVRVVTRRHSRRELARATDRVLDFLDERRIPWSEAGGCSSSRGIQIGVPMDPRDLPVRRQRLERVAGTRVSLIESYVSF